MIGQLQFLFEMYASNHNLTSLPKMKLMKPNMFFGDISQSGKPRRIFVL